MASRFLLFFFISNLSYACGLKTEIVSLSGPITMLLEELDLLSDKKLLAISTFHPIAKTTTARILVGGLFLSKKELGPYQENPFFFDKSMDLSKLLKNSDINKAIEVETRSLGAFEVLELSQKLITPYLKNCTGQMAKITKSARDLKERIKKQKNLKLIFFLGKIKNKLPDYIIVNDGFVSSLKKHSSLSSYKSDLAYVVWSQKQLANYNDYLKVGIYEAKSLEIIKIDKQNINIGARGVLTPGISQVNFLASLVSKKELGF